MFRVSTLDAKNPPLTENGDVDYSQDFFGKETYLTVSGQLNVESQALAYLKCIHLVQLLGLKILTLPDIWQNFG